MSVLLGDKTVGTLVESHQVVETASSREYSGHLAN